MILMFELCVKDLEFNFFPCTIKCIKLLLIFQILKIVQLLLLASLFFKKLSDFHRIILLIKWLVNFDSYLECKEFEKDIIHLFV